MLSPLRLWMEKANVGDSRQRKNRNRVHTVELPREIVRCFWVGLIYMRLFLIMHLQCSARVKDFYFSQKEDPCLIACIRLPYYAFFLIRFSMESSHLYAKCFSTLLTAIEMDCIAKWGIQPRRKKSLKNRLTVKSIRFCVDWHGFQWNCPNTSVETHDRKWVVQQSYSGKITKISIACCLPPIFTCNFE